MQLRNFDSHVTEAMSMEQTEGEAKPCHWSNPMVSQLILLYNQSSTENAIA